MVFLYELVSLMVQMFLFIYFTMYLIYIFHEKSIETFNAHKGPTMQLKVKKIVKFLKKMFDCIYLILVIVV
jgi:hypothetical protein